MKEFNKNWKNKSQQNLQSSQLEADLMLKMKSRYKLHLLLPDKLWSIKIHRKYSSFQSLHCFSIQSKEKQLKFAKSKKNKFMDKNCSQRFQKDKT